VVESQEEAVKPFFIVNPNSANGATRQRFMSVEPELRRAFPEMTLAFTEGPMDAATLAGKACCSDEDVIVVCGGDGTLNEVVHGLMESEGDAVLAVMPSGTGGDFRRMLGLTREPSDVVEYLSHGEPRPVDTGVAEYTDNEGRQSKRAFMNIASCGISGQVDRYVNTSTKVLGGKASFFLGSLRGMLKYDNVPMTVKVDGEQIHDGPANLVAASNGRFFGGGMMAAPNASLDDGLFDVLVFGDLSKLEFIGLSGRIYSGQHLDHPKISVTHGKVLEVESQGIALIDMDGEQVGQTPMKVEVRPASLRLLVPGKGSRFAPLEGAFGGR